MLHLEAALPLAIIVAACSMPAAPFAPDEASCSASLEESGHTSPLRFKVGPCRSDRHLAECAAAGLPSSWSAEVGCATPLREAGEGRCVGRARRLEGCEPIGGILCCPEE